MLENAVDRPALYCKYCGAWKIGNGDPKKECPICGHRMILVVSLHKATGVRRHSDKATKRDRSRRS